MKNFNSLGLNGFDLVELTISEKQFVTGGNQLPYPITMNLNLKDPEIMSALDEFYLADPAEFWYRMGVIKIESDLRMPVGIF